MVENWTDFKFVIGLPLNKGITANERTIMYFQWMEILIKTMLPFYKPTG